jgi:hypothetical protein
METRRRPVSGTIAGSHIVKCTLALTLAVQLAPFATHAQARKFQPYELPKHYASLLTYHMMAARPVGPMQIEVLIKSVSQTQGDYWTHRLIDCVGKRMKMLGESRTLEGLETAVEHEKWDLVPPGDEIIWRESCRELLRQTK